MGRFAILLLVLTACPKQAKEAELEPLGSNTPPPTGRSVTKVEEDEGGSGSGLKAKLAAMGADNGSGDTGTPPTAKTGGALEKADAEKKLFGGDGSPPYIDDEGHLHGPGGPVFMGKGPECNADRDHCIRPQTWFAVDNLVAGKMYRATPIFEFEKKWYNWRGKETSFSQRFKTKVGTKSTLHPGNPVIWFIDENASKKWVDNEYDALTSSRWVAGVVEEFVGSDKIRVKGWTYGLVPIDTTRVVVETK